MRTLIRRILNRLFTSLAGMSVLLMAAALVVILGPILWRGGSAIFFKGTVEFRRMQLHLFNQGDTETVDAEVAQCEAARKPLWDLVDEFGRGIDTDHLAEQARDAIREFNVQMRNRAESGEISHDEGLKLRRNARELRNLFTDAMETTDKDDALAKLDELLESPDKAALKGTAGQELLDLAKQYKTTVETVDLSRRDEYKAQLAEVRKLLTRLFGPGPGREPEADLAQFQYGATRWDKAQEIRSQLNWVTKYVPDGPGKPLKEIRVSRPKEFAGTKLAAMFPMIDEHLGEMLHPRRTFYWRYFTQESTPGHLFGGVGPEIVGTLMLTAFTMLFALPIGIMTAAYLVECTRESLTLRVLRTCVNTLAGVPSIVFGLFGLAFFMLWLLPMFHLPQKRSVIAGALTLGVLVLPIIIRASEEAIRSVPQSYKEASLSLGAGGLRTFLLVTLPAAMPGIMTGIILSMSRAAGETAPILFTAAMATRTGAWSVSPLEPCKALPYASWDMAVSDRLATEAPYNQFGMVLTLILLVLLLNIVAIVIRSRLSRRLRGG